MGYKPSPVFLLFTVMDETLPSSWLHMQEAQRSCCIQIFLKLLSLMAYMFLNAFVFQTVLIWLVWVAWSEHFNKCESNIPTTLSDFNAVIPFDSGNYRLMPLSVVSHGTEELQIIFSLIKWQVKPGSAFLSVSTQDSSRHAFSVGV